MKTEIYDFNSYPQNERTGTYGGNAGQKEGIDYNGEKWIIKYPQNTIGMRGALPSYTSSPLSEYIGSHIYDMLGIDVHETQLGIRNNKLVVACKDFCKVEGSLREMRTIKNIHNDELEEKISSHSDETRKVAIENVLIYLDYNPILKTIPDAKKRFWEQVIVDVFINNNDRNNGNWGVIYENGAYRLAPVFDNGGSFSPKLPDFKIEQLIQLRDRFEQSMETARTVYSLNGQELYAKDVSKLNYEDLRNTANALVPIIENKLPEISEFINDIPCEYNGYSVCSQIRKEFYVESIKYKYEHFLKPLMSDAKGMSANIAEQKTSEEDEELDLTDLTEQSNGRK